MGSKPVIMVVCGTRPDAIKSAPVALELKEFDAVETVIVSTGQHREMLDQALGTFGLTPDIDLGIMTQGQSLSQVTCRALSGIDQAIENLSPNWVVGQGDTTSTFVASLAAFYRQVPFAHVEAGLRTDTVLNPFPEEFNRRASGQLAAVHFAPTQWAAENLRQERVPPENIFVTGNTGIDALLTVLANTTKEWYADEPRRIVLLTTHRRENLGEPQREIAEAVKELLDRHEDLLAVVPMHRNPAVRATLQDVLGNHVRCDLIEPPDYAEFVTLMKRADLILTDSGGVQEEAPTFGKPVLVLRTTTERPEGVKKGVAKLIGTDRERIVHESSELLNDRAHYEAMALAGSPYGDGKAAERIRWVLLDRLGIESPKVNMWQ